MEYDIFNCGDDGMVTMSIDLRYINFKFLGDLKHSPVLSVEVMHEDKLVCVIRDATEVSISVSWVFSDKDEVLGFDEFIARIERD